MPLRAPGGLFGALAGTMMTAGCAPGRALDIHVSGDGDGAPCVAEVEGLRIAPEDLRVLARRWRGREAHLRATATTPYRCMGSIIFELQRAGFRRIGFISEPAVPGQ